MSIGLAFGPVHTVNIHKYTYSSVFVSASFLKETECWFRLLVSCSPSALPSILVAFSCFLCFSFLLFQWNEIYKTVYVPACEFMGVCVCVCLFVCLSVLSFLSSFGQCKCSIKSFRSTLLRSVLPLCPLQASFYFICLVLFLYLSCIKCLFWLFLVECGFSKWFSMRVHNCRSMQILYSDCDVLEPLQNTQRLADKDKYVNLYSYYNSVAGSFPSSSPVVKLQCTCLLDIESSVIWRPFMCMYLLCYYLLWLMINMFYE